MAVDVRINGADYPDVPAIDVPKTNNGGTATFYDCSGDTATAADVASGKTCHTAGGLVTGTASGGENLGTFFTSHINTKEIACPPDSLFFGINVVDLTLTGCTSISDRAFNNNYRLESLNAPDVVEVNNYALQYCVWLTDLNIPSCKNIETGALDGSFRLERIIAPLLENIGAFAFRGCSALQSINCQNLKSLGNSAFKNCDSLLTFSAPLLKTIPDSGLSDCDKLNVVDVPMVESIAGYGLEYCKALPSIRLPVISSIGSSAFAHCIVLKDIYIGSSSVPTLSSVAAFAYTPIAMSGSYSSADARIHVRSEMVEAFQAATNWSTFASKIVGDYSD